MGLEFRLLDLQGSTFLITLETCSPQNSLQEEMVLSVFNQVVTSINCHFHVSILTMFIHLIVIMLGHLKNFNILIWSLHIKCVLYAISFENAKLGIVEYECSQTQQLVVKKEFTLTFTTIFDGSLPPSAMQAFSPRQSPIYLNVSVNL